MSAWIVLASLRGGLVLDHLPPEITKLWPPLAGALTALLWLRENWLRTIGTVLAGLAMSHILTDDIAEWAGWRPGSTGYVIGLLGAAVLDKMFTTWRRIDIGSLFTRFLERRLGLPHAPTKPGDLQ